MRPLFRLAASALRLLALPLLWIGEAAAPVLAAARWCEDRAWGLVGLTPPETGRPAPTDAKAGGRR
ncbi:hypothetical protein [Methylobacterium sp. JK268]